MASLTPHTDAAREVIAKMLEQFGDPKNPEAILEKRMAEAILGSIILQISQAMDERFRREVVFDILITVLANSITSTVFSMQQDPLKAAWLRNQFIAMLIQRTSAAFGVAADKGSSFRVEAAVDDTPEGTG